MPFDQRARTRWSRRSSAWAHAPGFTVVAEGIETAGQHEVLARLGCDTGQGHLLSKPCPASLVDDLLLGD